VIAYDFTAESLDSLDSLQAELLVLPFFADERPLRGAAGLVDWRLCGALSRKLMAGYLDGRFGDKALLASPGKVKMDGLLLIGLGHSEEFGVATAEQACALIASSLTDAGVSTAALALPGRSLGLIPSLDAMQIWLAAAPTQSRIEEIIVVERAEEHRVLESLIDGLRRQAESPLS
jgi:hypothetical protein